MTIDEAISEFKERVEDSKKISELGMKSYIPKAKEEEQLAEWLEELKAYRQYIDLTEIPEQYKLGFQDGIIAGNNKAIDDFAENIRLYYSLKQEMGYVATTYEDLINYIFDLAEQLKAGEQNESV